ncbi:MAG: hypothetical protein EPO11_06195 [Gammaproteobacteria bacterium]|nr:MAG: hypothetical protein EPO11_06195 [Gammaproteobacteria bacterium]
MTFIVILIALVIERFFDWSHLRRWHWLASFQQLVLKRMKRFSPYVTLALTIIPLLAVVLLIESLIRDWLYGFVSLIFNLLILLYCLGPRNFWADAFVSINALTHGEAPQRPVADTLFIQSFRRVFAVVFWYLILGVVGAVLYRVVTLSSTEAADQNTPPELLQPSRLLETVLDWVPVRIFTFIFALGGHFVQVMTCWRKQALLGLTHNETMLVDCGMAALGNEEPVEKNAISLLDRVFVITLVIIAILVLIL